MCLISVAKQIAGSVLPPQAIWQNKTLVVDGGVVLDILDLGHPRLLLDEKRLLKRGVWKNKEI